jgi:O-antigen/teichoic acid export membrane protein
VTIPELGHLRSRRLVRAGLSNLGAKIISVVLTLLLTPIIVRALGAERYGVYATVTMVVALLAFTDLGVGNGLVTRLAAAEGRASVEEQRWLVSTALALLLTVGTVLAVLSVVAAVVLPWPTLLGTAAVPASELRVAILVFGLLFAAGLPAGLGQKVLLGLQKGAEASAWLLGATATAVILTAIAATADASLAVVVGATVAPTAALGLVQTVRLFGVQRPELRPRRSDVSQSRVRALLGLSGLFFLLNVAVAVAFQTDLFVVSGILGAASAAVFSICLRLFGLVTQATTAALSQLWPAFAEALASDDRDWVRRTLRRTMAVTALVTVPAVTVLVLIGPALIRWWVGPTLVPPTVLLVAMACWTVQQCVIYPVAMLMNGAEIVRFQLIAASSMAIANLATSILLTRQVGLAGPVWASLMTHTLINALPAVWLVRRRFLVGTAGPSAGRRPSAGLVR